MRRTPASGTFFLASLLHQHYLDRQKPAILLSTWRKDLDSDPKDFIVLRAQAKGYEFVHSSLHNADLVIIFDEAQRTFEDEEFSLGLVKQQIGRKYGLKIYLFTSYGSLTGGPAARFGNSPLAFLEPQQRVSITTLSIEDRPSIPLLYNRQEFDDVVTRFCRSPSSLLNLDTGAHGCIFEFTDGQPGAVDAVLKMLEKVSSLICPR